MFLRNLVDRPGFGRLYFCSPWISFDKQQATTLGSAIHRYEQKNGRVPDMLVITRPDQGTEARLSKSTAFLRDFGATVYLNKNLHTKLYIREPDFNGGYSMAIVGSQNLTRSNYLELGIRINSDGPMINQLISYFFEISSNSQNI